MPAPRPQAIARCYQAASQVRSGSGLFGLLHRLFPQPECGCLVIDAPNGKRFVTAGAQPGPRAHLRLHNWKCLGRMLARGDIGFSESYIAGEMSSPDLNALMAFALQNADASTLLQQLQGPRLLLRVRHALNRNTKRGSRRNIAAHYDLGNDFYAQWLDRHMQYSSALFSRSGQTLEEAQENKLNRVSQLLELSGGERVLEIGCGWGGLAQHLVERHECHVTGVTLSARQLEFARERVRAHHWSRSCELRLQDYRDVRETFDRIASIEMLEAVGEAYWPTYFRKLRDTLRPGGVAVLQVITIDETRFDAYRRRPDFIQRYIFPGGMLPTPSIIRQQAADAGLHFETAEFFGDSYAQTLAEWQTRFQRAWPVIESLGFDDRFKRTWEYYLTYCQVGFEAGTVNVGLYKIRRPPI